MGSNNQSRLSNGLRNLAQEIYTAANRLQSLNDIVGAENALNSLPSAINEARSAVDEVKKGNPSKALKHIEKLEVLVRLSQ